MIKYLCRHNKDYSRFNIIKQLTENIDIPKDIFILLPFSKNEFFKNFLKRDRIINDFFISNYDTYVFDRKKITNKNPRAWWKYFQDWTNFRYSRYLLSDTNEHFKYWEELFGNFQGKHFVLPVLADKTIYYPDKNVLANNKGKILFYGSFIPLHGIDIILDAFKILEDKNIEFEANIIGKGQIYKKMNEKFQQLNLQNVKMKGDFISESKLAEEIRKSDIILGIFGESKKAQSVVPNKVYQALACRKATITMQSKAINEFFDTNEIVSCEPTAQSLSNKMILLLENEDLRLELSKNGYIKFCKIYNDAEINFKKFISTIK